MSKTLKPFDFAKPVAYDAEAKRAFHSSARRQLKELADALSLLPSSYGLRSNPAAVAISGEVTLHADRLYVQASQSSMGPRYGILFRTCMGRKDYVGGRNNFASLDLLNRPEDLARRIRQVCHV
jgi:hypothetical protein